MASIFAMSKDVRSPGSGPKPLSDVSPFCDSRYVYATREVRSALLYGFEDAQEFVMGAREVCLLVRRGWTVGIGTSCPPPKARISVPE